jgi:hypothetical protein
MGGKRRWTDEQLRAAVATWRTWASVLRELHLIIRRTNQRRLLRRCEELAIDTRHLAHAAESRAGVSDEQLRVAVAESRSIAQVLRALGLVAAGGNYQAIPRRIAKLGLDTSHFTGQGWNRGGRVMRARPLADVLVTGRATGSHKLKLRLFRAGLKTPACELCGWAEAAPDGRIPVELDHTNGDRTDNRLENLRILCPNCHSLQPTHRGLNKQSRRTSG